MTNLIANFPPEVLAAHGRIVDHGTTDHPRVRELDDGARVPKGACPEILVVSSTETVAEGTDDKGRPGYVFILLVECPRCGYKLGPQEAFVAKQT